MERWTMRRCLRCNLLWPQESNTCFRCTGDLPYSTVVEVVTAQGARTTDPDTSKLAALRQRPRSGTQRARILEALEAGPLTAREIEMRTGIRGAWKRISELKAGELIHTADVVYDPFTATEVSAYEIGPPVRRDPTPAPLFIDGEDAIPHWKGG
jgi:hypothetical protein